MSDAPERIWAEMPEVFDGMGFWQEHKSADLMEYVRADILAQTIAANAALVKRLEEARGVIELIADAYGCECGETARAFLAGGE